MISSLLTHSLLLFSSVLTSWVSLTTSTTTTSSCGQQRPPNPHNNHGKILMMNQIDSCWRLDSTWATNRRVLAKCAKGFGRGAIGGEHGATYMVTDPSDDPINPKPGTLRYGAIQNEALWIIFNRDMVITLKNELMINSYKTIDGRGVNIEIAYGPCITIYRVKHIIIHGISIHDCKPGKPGLVRSSPERVRKRSGCDGDGIEIFSSSDIWIDHCFLARCTDGLLDVIHGSTAITVSNNYFTQHDKVMLLGNNDDFKGDNVMKVTVVFNHFGPGLVQRMPRVRIGYAHVVNNRYDEWKMYAIGGSANPTIFSQGNYFTAPNNPGIKQVTKRENINNIQGWKKWKWRSMEDEFENGAYFVESGKGSCSPNYTHTQSFHIALGSDVPSLTSNAGPLTCLLSNPCHY